MRVLVLGGSGHLGRALIEGLLESGDSVVSISSRAGITPDADPESFRHYDLEVGADRSLEDLISDDVSIQGPFDGVLSLVGRSPRGIRLETSPQEFLEELAQGALPTWSVLSQCAPHVAEGGSMVIVSSLWGCRVPEPRMYLDLRNEPGVATVAAKAAQRQMARYFAVLLAGRNIRVNLLTPGWFPQMRGEPREDYMDEIKTRTPMKRIGKPEELVAPAIFLLGQGSAFITGQELIVDGGYSLW